jgi:predicted dinucleotide-binding enzyme
MNASYSDLVISPDTSTAEELQKLLRHSKIVKVFNTTLVPDFTDGKRSDSFLASNNGHALEVVSEIMATAGFNPVVVGDLSVCRTLEHKQRSASRLL